MTGRDDFTSTVDAAAAYEKYRALATGDYDEPDPLPDLVDVQP